VFAEYATGVDKHSLQDALALSYRMDSWKRPPAGVPATPAVAVSPSAANASRAADYLDRCGALAAAAAAGLSGMMLAVTSPTGLAAFSTCLLNSVLFVVELYE